MNFKIISLREVFMDDGVTDPEIRLHLDVEELIQQEKEKLQQLRSTYHSNYFEMVPEEFRGHLDRVARTAYDKRGMIYIKYEDFREIISENWLLKRAVFMRISSELGFSSVKYIKHDTDVAVLILTISGSFLVISRPEDEGIRSINYIRIKEREKNPTLETLNSPLYADVAVGSRLVAFDINTSDIMYMSISEDANDPYLSLIAENLRSGFAAIDSYTNTRIATQGRRI